METITSNTQRLEMRVDLETKQLAERAASVLGCASLTEYITRLIRENSPKIIQQQTEIRLSQQQFERFMTLCQDTRLKPGKKILAAAKKLDSEGF